MNYGTLGFLAFRGGRQQETNLQLQRALVDINENNYLHVLINNIRTAWPAKILMAFSSF